MSGRTGPGGWKFPFRLAFALNLSDDLVDVFKPPDPQVFQAIKEGIGQICNVITIEDFFFVIFSYELPVMTYFFQPNCVY